MSSTKSNFLAFKPVRSLNSHFTEKEQLCTDKAKINEMVESLKFYDELDRLQSIWLWIL